jgi:predicted glycogen debranching enzyme
MPPLNIGDGRNLSALTGREWLLTDGRGGYALGTHAGLNTRKYHGLLIVSRPAPTGRLLLVSRLEETLAADGSSAGLDTGCYEPGVLHPEGYGRLVDFTRDPYPTWRFRALDREIRRTVRLGRPEGGLVVTWELLEGEPAWLEVRPLLTRRSHHAVARAGDFMPIVEIAADGFLWRARAGDPATAIKVDGTVDDATPYWYRDALYIAEKDRGYECVEDLHAPCRLKLRLEPKRPVRLTARAEDEPAGKASPAAAPPPRRLKDELFQTARAALVAAADAFLIRGPTGAPGIVAGYPWFEEWGRDTMIALPGILLSTGRAEVAFEMLSAWGARLREGLLPNRLGDHHAVEDNSADAPLLFVRAVEMLDRVLRAPRRIERAFFPAVNQILDHFHRGTRHGIGVDSDGLLRAGQPGLALTWMDAVLNGEAVTPRRGKPIELNALYGEALRYGAELADRCDDDALGAVYRERGEALAAGMREKFLDPATGFLRDVVDISGPGDGDAFRPNLLFALAAKSSPFTVDEAEKNLARTAVELVTPFGLRTLSPLHEKYVPRYEGDQPSRDRAYHQGTVWPWLIGIYADAVLNVRTRVPSARDTIEAALTPLLKFVVDHGSLPEVFDGDRPHAPGGCPAQAWSVAEVLRALDSAT